MSAAEPGAQGRDMCEATEHISEKAGTRAQRSWFQTYKPQPLKDVGELRVAPQLRAEVRS